MNPFLPARISRHRRATALADRLVQSNRITRRLLSKCWLPASCFAFAFAATPSKGATLPPLDSEPAPPAHVRTFIEPPSLPDLPRELSSSFDLLPAESGRSAPMRSASKHDHQLLRRHHGSPALRHEHLRSLASLGTLLAPVLGAVVSSPYGWRVHPILKRRLFHKGIDLAAPEGTPVQAAREGVVEDAGWRGNYGYYVRIRHSRHLETAYAHLSRIRAGIRRGAPVNRGEVIAAVGSTGWSTGPHLYYEVIVDGHRINPMPAYHTGSRVRQSEPGQLQTVRR